MLHLNHRHLPDLRATHAVPQAIDPDIDAAEPPPSWRRQAKLVRPPPIVAQHELVRRAIVDRDRDQQAGSPRSSKAVRVGMTIAFAVAGTKNDAWPAIHR